MLSNRIEYANPKVSESNPMAWRPEAEETHDGLSQPSKLARRIDLTIGFECDADSSPGAVADFTRLNKQKSAARQ